jgi:hypothetical protein
VPLGTAFVRPAYSEAEIANSLRETCRRRLLVRSSTDREPTSSAPGGTRGPLASSPAPPKLCPICGMIHGGGTPCPSLWNNPRPSLTRDSLGVDVASVTLPSNGGGSSALFAGLGTPAVLRARGGAASGLQARTARITAGPRYGLLMCAPTRDWFGFRWGGPFVFFFAGFFCSFTTAIVQVSRRAGE